MSIATRFRDKYIVAPFAKVRELSGYDLSKKCAVDLVWGTIAKESEFIRLRQIGLPLDSEVGAFGLGQSELESHNNVIKKLELNHPKLLEAVQSFYFHDEDLKFNLMFNFEYSVLICRCLYYTWNDPLPEAGDIEGMGEYWKEKYNTPAGKGTVQQFIDSYKRYCK